MTRVRRKIAFIGRMQCVKRALDMAERIEPQVILRGTRHKAERLRAVTE